MWGSFDVDGRVDSRDREHARGIIGQVAPRSVVDVPKTSRQSNPLPFLPRSEHSPRDVVLLRRVSRHGRDDGVDGPAGRRARNGRLPVVELLLDVGELLAAELPVLVRRQVLRVRAENPAELRLAAERARDVEVFLRG